MLCHQLRCSLLVCVGLICAALMAGCTGYHLGNGAQAPLAFSSLHVAPVKMRAQIAQAEAILTGALREAFAQDGRLALAQDADAAGAVLEVTIRSYRRDIATADPSDTGLARKLTLIMRAELTLRPGGSVTVAYNGSAHKNYFTARPIELRRDVFIDSGQQQAEYQALPLLAQDLAVAALHAVLDTW